MECVVPARRGEWVDRYGGMYANPLYECSECKEAALYKYNYDLLLSIRWVQVMSEYCPHCGANMKNGGNKK